MQSNHKDIYHLELNELITTVNDAVWGYVLIFALVGCGVWFTFRTRFVQFRMIGEMVRLLTDSVVDTAKEEGVRRKHISSFQAFAVSVATRVGTGNLAGVASAIAIGGPGAVFWMWLIALIGSATAFVESTLAQLFKQKHKDSFIGGPAYYIQRGLHLRWMAVTFAVLITCQFGLSNNSIQANTICGAMQEAFGWEPMWVGVVLAALGLFIVFGGIQRIAHVSSILVPVMAIGYVVLAIVIIAMNIRLLPSVFKIIFENAFGFQQFAGGTFGAMMMTGIKRGLFSNEAGEGSAACAASIADVSHPVKQGLVQALSVFTDTLLICSCTAFIILLSGVYTNPDLNGIQLTQNALLSEVGKVGPAFVALAIFMFAFSSIIGNYTYGEMNVKFLTKKRGWLFFVRVMNGIVMVMFGALASLDLVWSLGDLFMGCITLCNLYAIVRLHPLAVSLLKDYVKQKRAGIKSPEYHNEEFEAWKP